MIVEAIKYFGDKAEKVDRYPGDQWEVDEDRFEALNATVYGELVKPVGEKDPQKEEAPKEPTKADLVERAEALGIKVSSRATKDEIEKLIADAEEE